MFTAATAPDAPSDIAPTRRRLETQGKLLDAALAVFSELGLQGAAVETICARAGFSRGAFYSNFSSKEQLFLALLAREFDHRVEHFATRAEEIEPALRACDGAFSSEQAAEFITQFFGSTADAATWFVLEAEFLLLVIREPSLAPDYQQFLDSFHLSMAGGIEQILAAAGRRFALPAERAIPILAGVYERTLRAAALGGTDAHDDIEQLSEHMAELVFVITEVIPVEDSTLVM